MNQNKSRLMPTSMGASLILVVLLVLCLTIFALLSYLTANSEWKLASKTAQSVAAYYDTDTKAQEMLLRIQNAYDGAQPLEDIVGVSVKQHAQSYAVSFVLPITQQQSLSVRALLSPGEYKITEYRSSTVLYEFEEGLNIWDGQ